MLRLPHGEAGGMTHEAAQCKFKCPGMLCDLQSAEACSHTLRELHAL